MSIEQVLLLTLLTLLQNGLSPDAIAQVLMSSAMELLKDPEAAKVYLKSLIEAWNNHVPEEVRAQIWNVLK